MIVRVSELTGYAGVRSVFVSVPLVEQLVDGVKYLRPGDAKLKPPERSVHTYRSNPTPMVHDRRARDIPRGLADHIIDDEVTDPYDATATVLVARSVRGDVLADHLARGHIDQAQFMGGRRFQELFSAAERGPKSMPLAERVDGNPPREPLTDRQLKARRELARAYRALGHDGTALTLAVLIRSQTMQQIAEARGLTGQVWQRYLSGRFGECLNRLAVTYGFAGSLTGR
jgi:hypothetical protein